MPFKDVLTPTEELVLMSMHLSARCAGDAIEAIKQATDGKVDIPTGTASPVIQQLRRKGLIEQVRNPNPDLVNPVYYTATQAGRELLVERTQTRKRLMYGYSKKEALPPEEIQELPVPEPSRKPLSVREPVAIE